eukprot:849021-Pyramimonas_sp.AAC.1
MGPLEASWGPLEAEGWDFRFVAPLLDLFSGRLGAVLRPSWVPLGPSWEPLGASWGPLGHAGRFLGLSWSVAKPRK